MNKESIVLGSGDLYCTEFEGTNAEMPTNEELETEENRLGHIKGGAEIEYAPSFYEAKDDMGKVSKVIITEEEATMKSGIMTWCGTTLKKLCQTARVTEDAEKKKRTVKIGGIGNADGKRYVLHFVHKDTVDGDVRVTIVEATRPDLPLLLPRTVKRLLMQNLKHSPWIKRAHLFCMKRIWNP